MALHLKGESENPTSNTNNYVNPYDDLDNEVEKEITFVKIDEGEQDMADPINIESGDTLVNYGLSVILTICGILGFVAGIFWIFGVLDQDSSNFKLQQYKVATVVVTKTNDIYVESEFHAGKKNRNAYYDFIWYQPFETNIKDEQGMKVTYFVDAKLKSVMETVRYNSFGKAKSMNEHKANEATAKYKKGDVLVVYIPKEDAKVLDPNKAYIAADIDNQIEAGKDMTQIFKTITLTCILIAAIVLVVTKIMDKISSRE